MDGRSLLAHNLRLLRVARGISQEHLAADAKIDRAYLGGLERRNENPTIDLLDRLARTLNAKLADFFIEPAADALPPAPLKGGRRRK